MTKQEKTILAQPYFDGVRWHRSVGEPFDTSKLDERVVEKMEAKGYLMTPAAFKARTNPEAAQAQELADTNAAQLQAIYDVLPGVTTPDGAVTAIQAIQGKVPSAEDLERVSSARTFVQELGKLFPNAKGADALLTAVRQAQASAANPDDLRSLAEYRTHVGELLPAGLAPQARKVLLEHNLVGKVVISRTSDAELLALNGVAQGSVDTLREWSPLHPSLVPKPAEE